MKKTFLVLFASLTVCMLSAQTTVSNKKGDFGDTGFPERSFPRKEPRVLNNIPAQHFPNPGECRIWYPERVLGEQPPVMKCDALIGIMLQEGAFILLHNGKAYDTEYDWKRDRNKERDKERNGKIPQAVIDILFGPGKSI